MAQVSIDSLTLLAVRSAEILEKIPDAMDDGITEDNLVKHKKLYDLSYQMMGRIASMNSSTVPDSLTSALKHTLNAYGAGSSSKSVILADPTALRYLQRVLSTVQSFIYGKDSPKLSSHTAFLSAYLIIGVESLPKNHWVYIEPPSTVGIPISPYQSEVTLHSLCIGLRLIAYRAHQMGRGNVTNPALREALEVPFTEEEVQRVVSCLSHIYPKDTSLTTLVQTVDSEIISCINQYLPDATQIFLGTVCMSHPHISMKDHPPIIVFDRDNFWLNLMLSGDINPGVLLRLPNSISDCTDIEVAYKRYTLQKVLDNLEENVLSDPQLQVMLQGLLPTESREGVLNFLRGSLIGTTTSVPTSSLGLGSIDEAFIAKVEYLLDRLKKTLPRLTLKVLGVRHATRKEL